MTLTQRLALMLRWADEIRRLDWPNGSHALLYASAEAEAADDAEFRAYMFLSQEMAEYAWAFAIAYVLLTEETGQ